MVTWIQIPSLLSIGCVILSKLFCLSTGYSSLYKDTPTMHLMESLVGFKGDGMYETYNA